MTIITKYQRGRVKHDSSQFDLVMLELVVLDESELNTGETNYVCRLIFGKLEGKYVTLGESEIQIFPNLEDYEQERASFLRNAREAVELLTNALHALDKPKIHVATDHIERALDRLKKIK